MSHVTVSPGSPELSRGRQVLTLPSQIKVHPLALTAFICGILALDFTTGPYIQVAILLVFPVAIATWSYGRRWGLASAVILPLLRLPFFFYFWQIPRSWLLESMDTGTDILVLVARYGWWSTWPGSGRRSMFSRACCRPAASASASGTRAVDGSRWSTTSLSARKPGSATPSAPSAGSGPMATL